MPRITIGIDPDTKSTGIGVLRNGVPEFAVNAEAKGRYAYGRVQEMGYELVSALRACAEHLRDYRAVEVEIAVEWFRMYPKDLRQGVRKCNSIIDLQAVAGLAYKAAQIVFPQATIKHVYPVDWKGTIPKKVHQERLRRKLKSPLLDNAYRVLGKTKASHVLDGLGLALALYDGKV